MNARRTDKATSHAAARTINPTHKARLQAVFDSITGGLTAEEAARRAGLRHTGYWKRISDLHNDGWLIPLEENGRPVTRVASTGRRVTVWVKA